MPYSTIGNIFLILSVLSTASAQVVIKVVLSDIPPNATPVATILLLFSFARLWRTVLYGFLTVCGFIFWILCLNKLPLSYAYTIACSSALFVALFSVLFLQESVTWKFWIGTLLIALGTAFVVPKS